MPGTTPHHARDVIHSVLASPAIAPVLQKYFGPVKVKLLEHSTLVSRKGAKPQRWHIDVHPTKGQDDRMPSVGVALQDIAPDMGPPPHPCSIPRPHPHPCSTPRPQPPPLLHP